MMLPCKCDKYSVLEHVGRSIWGLRYRPENLFVICTSYFDEGGGKDHGFTLVGGYISTVEQWERFEVDWKLFLISYKVPYFHMAQLSQFKEPFAKWKGSPNFRARFLHEAAEIIQSHVLKGFTCYIDHDCFQKADSEYELSETYGSPYALAGMLAIARTLEWARSQPQKVEIEHVFEDGGPDKGGLMRAMEKGRLALPIFKPSRDIVDRKSGTRKGVVQLQAADYLVYEIRKYVRDYIKTQSGKKYFRGSLAALTGVDVDRYFLGYERIVNVCKNLSLNRRTKVSSTHDANAKSKTPQ
jgi:hypothetical protein